MDDLTNLHLERISPEKLAQYRAMLAKREANARALVLNAPPRPRPWHDMARPDQLPPDGDWNIWLILSGRGWGKSATGSAWIAEQAARNPETEWAIIAPTWRDCRKVCLEGRSGLLKALLPGELDSINLSDLTVRLTNGSKIYGYSADGYERLRGSNLAGAWVDEAAVMASVQDLFDEALMPALRIGEHPRVVVTTTPRPIKFLKKLIARTDGSVHVTRGSTKDNEKNLSATAIKELYARYGGTRAGRQELEGEILEDIEGALWTPDMLDDSRVEKPEHLPTMARIVVGFDPAVTSNVKSDETGIVVCGKSLDGHLYVLEDATMKGSPPACMTKAVTLFHKWHADRIVGEVNNGGDYIESLLRTVDPAVPYKQVRATRGKFVRAEPIAALWEQKRGHVLGVMPALEDQMCSMTNDPDESKTQASPNNLDAMVWSATELNFGSSSSMYLASIGKLCLNSECNKPNKKIASVCRFCGTKFDAIAA